ncbi:hypothetical protein DFH09DRAFT_1087186 [Mycena vulgaris]|nr:hypothetical protein DFH09DRAFT_1087186 [Mycena vulgaris]
MCSTVVWVGIARLHRSGIIGKSISLLIWHTRILRVNGRLRGSVYGLTRIVTVPLEVESTSPTPAEDQTHPKIPSMCFNSPALQELLCVCSYEYHPVRLPFFKRVKEAKQLPKAAEVPFEGFDDTYHTVSHRVAPRGHGLVVRNGVRARRIPLGEPRVVHLHAEHQELLPMPADERIAEIRNEERAQDHIFVHGDNDGRRGGSWGGYGRACYLPVFK